MLYESFRSYPEEERTLEALLDVIMPPSEDGKMPGAGELGISGQLRDQGALGWIREGLLLIAEESCNGYQREFSALSRSEQSEIADRLQRKLPRYFIRLTTAVLELYYQHDRVLGAIGLEARPPFPDGYRVEQGDLTLLEPVYERAKIYRD